MTIACRFLAIMCVTLLAWPEAAYSADPANRPVSQDSYVLVFQEHPRFEVLHKKNRTKDEILSDVYSVSLPAESVPRILSVLSAIETSRSLLLTPAVRALTTIFSFVS